MNALQKIYRYNGLQGFVTKLQRRFTRTYKQFLKAEVIPTKTEMEKQLAAFTYLPRISIITPLYQPVLSELTAYFESLLVSNVYANIELCLVNDGTEDAALEALIAQYMSQFPDKIKYQKNSVNKGIAAASNDALSLATGEYIALVDQDDMVAPHAFFEYIKAAQEQVYDFFYSDEDMLNERGERFNPAFKPDWAPHTLLSRMYVNHLSMYKKKIVDQVGGFRSAFDGAQDYDLLLRASVYFEAVCHVPQILYHWRASADSIAENVENKKYIYERAEAAIVEHLATQGLTAEVKAQDDYLIYNINIMAPEAKLNTIIFETSDDIAGNTQSWASLISNLERGQQYHIYVIDEHQSFEIPEQYGNIVTTKVAKLAGALEHIKATRGETTEHILFLASTVAFGRTDTLGYLTQLMQLPKIGLLSPTIVNQDMVITEAGRIIISEQELAFASFGVSFGDNNYFGNDLSLVNYSFVSPECFLLRADLLLNGESLAAATSFMSLLLILREHKDFYCVNVGNAYVQHVRDNFERSYVLPKSEHCKLVERYYNQNFSTNLSLLYKPKTEKENRGE